MFRNYLKIAIRNLAHNKIYSFINIAGLTIGFTCAIFTVSFQAIKAALANPVKSLRSE